MANYETEEEQIEALKSWWKENGTAILVGISVGLAGLFGWQYWQAEQQRNIQESSAAYSGILVELQSGNYDSVVSASSLLIEKYQSTTYAVLSALAKMRAELELGELDAAINTAKQAQSLAKEDDLKSIATLRLAQLLLDNADYAAAITELDTITIPQFVAEADVLRGDILLAQDDRAGAISAYKNALDAELSSQARVIATLKYESLAGKYVPSN